MRKAVLTLSVLFSIVMILAIVQVMMTNSLSTDGAMLSKLQSEVTRYKRDNAILKEKILSASAFTNIAKEAEEQGLTSSSQTYLLTPLPLALKQ